MAGVSRSHSTGAVAKGRAQHVVDPFNWTQKRGLKGSVLSQI